MNAPTAATELARNAPLTMGAAYLSFISQYGTILVTSLAIVYAILQMVLRVQEHRAIMRKNKEAPNVGE